MHAGQNVKADENASAQGFHRGAVMYRRVHGGMSAKRVRRQLGKPYDVERFNDVGGREVCWYYGDVFAGEETVNVALAPRRPRYYGRRGMARVRLLRHVGKTPEFSSPH